MEKTRVHDSLYMLAFERVFCMYVLFGAWMVSPIIFGLLQLCFMWRLLIDVKRQLKVCLRLRLKSKAFKLKNVFCKSFNFKLLSKMRFDYFKSKKVNIYTFEISYKTCLF